MKGRPLLLRTPFSRFGGAWVDRTLLTEDFEEPVAAAARWEGFGDALSFDPRGTFEVMARRPSLGTGGIRTRETFQCPLSPARAFNPIFLYEEGGKTHHIDGLH